VIARLSIGGNTHYVRLAPPKLMVDFFIE